MEGALGALDFTLWVTGFAGLIPPGDYLSSCPCKIGFVLFTHFTEPLFSRSTLCSTVIISSGFPFTQMGSSHLTVSILLPGPVQKWCQCALRICGRGLVQRIFHLGNLLHLPIRFPCRKTVYLFYNLHPIV